MNRLMIDTDLCEGYGNCVFEADDYLELDDDTAGPDAVARIVRSEVTEEDHDRVQLAIASCPVAALRIAP